MEWGWRNTRRLLSTYGMPGSNTRCLTLMISIYSYRYTRDRQYYCPHFTDEKIKAHKPVKQTKTCLRPHTLVVCRTPSHFSYLIFSGGLETLQKTANSQACLSFPSPVLLASETAQRQCSLLPSYPHMGLVTGHSVHLSTLRGCPALGQGPWENLGGP